MMHYKNVTPIQNSQHVYNKNIIKQEKHYQVDQ